MWGSWRVDPARLYCDKQFGQKHVSFYKHYYAILYNNGTLDKTDVHKWSTRDSRTIFSPFIIPHYRENDTLSINVERMDNSIDGLLIFRIF